MMKFFLVLIIVSTFLSCCIEDCPPDEHIGTLLLTELSHELLPYDEVSGLVFVKNGGDTVRFTTQKLVDTLEQDFCVFKPCAILLRDETCLRMDIERRCVQFENESMTIHLQVKLRNTQFDLDEGVVDTFYSEVMSSTIVQDGNSRFNSFIYSDRGFDIDTGILEPSLAQFDTALTLETSRFQNVYSEDSMIWFSQGIGLVGFEWNNELYVLDEVLR